MKLFVDDKVYLQGYDLRTILLGTSWFPEICQELFSDILPGGEQIIAIDPEAMTFDHEFHSKDVVNWARKQEWIVDYEEMSQPQNELTDIAEESAAYDRKAHEIRDELVAHGDTMQRDQRRRRKEQMVRCLHKADSLRRLIAVLLGTKQLILPADHHPEPAR